MPQFLITQLEYLFRLLCAALCGLLVGHERENHLKMAGTRTHMLVSLASALMMLISKYGFYDVLKVPNISLDPSRIAAGVVTAIGFLGAGVIFTHKMNISGLTTSAGIWATVGIGSAFGAGMYPLGAVSTVLVLLIQFGISRKKRRPSTATVEQIILRMELSEDLQSILEHITTSGKIVISSIHATRVEENMLEVKLYVHFPDAYNIYDIIGLLKDDPHICSINI